MKKNVLLLFLFFSLYACDSGDIYPDEPLIEEGRNVKVVFSFLCVDSFPKEYKIALAAFQEGIDYPLVIKTISTPLENTPINIKLINIPKIASSVQLCILQNDNRRLYSFYTALIPEQINEMIIPDTTINLLKYGRIQEQIFRQCIACHGGSGNAGANLYLTAELSYENLYDVPSLHSPKKRVTPFIAHESFIIDVLTEQLEILHFNHNTGISSLKKDDVVLLDEWIKNGAKKND